MVNDTSTSRSCRMRLAPYCRRLAANGASHLHGSRWLRPGRSKYHRWRTDGRAVQQLLSRRCKFCIWNAEWNGRWQRSPDDIRIDAALLLPGIRHAVPTSDPRTVARRSMPWPPSSCETIMSTALRTTLGHSARPKEALLLCGLLLAVALEQQGEHREHDPGLLSEEFDITQRELRGNVPQAFVHALLECSAALRPGQSDRSA